MLNLTGQEAIKLHRELWSRIVEKLEKDEFKYMICFDLAYQLKVDTLNEMGYLEDVVNLCFACDYAYDQVTDYQDHICDHCPLIWPDEMSDEKDKPCIYTGKRYGLYSKFHDCFARWSYDVKEAWNIARQIRDLPAKCEQEEEEE